MRHTCGSTDQWNGSKGLSRASCNYVASWNINRLPIGMCSLWFFWMSWPVHPCTMPQMSANTSSYSGLFHQIHVCTQTHSQFTCVCFPLPHCICPTPNPHSQMASAWRPPKFGFLDLVFSIWFLVLLLSLSFSPFLCVVLGKKLSSSVLCL